MYPQHERATQNLVALFKKDPEVLAVILPVPWPRGWNGRIQTSMRLSPSQRKNIAVCRRREEPRNALRRAAAMRAAILT